MTWAVFAAAITSALLHGAWNMLAKTRAAPREIFGGIVLATASLCAPVAAVFGLPNLHSWPWLIAASIANVAYLRTLTYAYALSGFAPVYAVVRGTIPPTMFLFGWLLLTEKGGATVMIGLLLITSSFYVFVASYRKTAPENQRGLVVGIGAGLLLALSLFFDVSGIRANGSGPLNLAQYSAISSLATASVLAACSLAQRISPIRILVDNARLCYGGAALLLTSYLCGMWAYAQGPISLVAPVRESGLLFGGLLAVLVLRERVSNSQWMAMALATTGVILIQLR
jgi:drug/metabolite transporter (DMT)-like permease